MLIKIYPENPAPRHIRQVVKTLSSGGTIIFPTDTVYGMGASVFENKAIDKIIRLKGIKRKDVNFSFIF